jgi:large subunit ribosomal protein L10
MQLEQKKQFVKDFSEKLKSSKSLILAYYQGLDVNNITELREKVKEAGCTMQVVKNRLALRAIDESGIESLAQLKEYFKGPVAVLLGENDPSGAIKIFKKYVDDNKLMEFKAAVISDNLFDAEQVAKIADLPSREELIAKTVYVFNAPIQGLCNVLAGIIKKLCYALNDLKEKKESGAIKTAEPATQEAPVEETAPEAKKQEAAEEVQASETSEEVKETEETKEEAKEAEEEIKEETAENKAEENKEEETKEISKDDAGEQPEKQEE